VVRQDAGRGSQPRISRRWVERRSGSPSGARHPVHSAVERAAPLSASLRRSPRREERGTGSRPQRLTAGIPRSLYSLSLTLAPPSPSSRRMLLPMRPRHAFAAPIGAGERHYTYAPRCAQLNPVAPSTSGTWLEAPAPASFRMGRPRNAPSAGREWSWRWALPATGPHINRETGQCRRQHAQEPVIQKAVRAVVQAPASRSERRAACRTTPSPRTAWSPEPPPARPESRSTRISPARLTPTLISEFTRSAESQPPRRRSGQEWQAPRSLPTRIAH
jgi:hypothetical protein